MAGDKYQWLYVWEGCVQAYKDATEGVPGAVVEVGVEVTDAGNVDDVVYYRADGGPTRYAQVKYAVDASTGVGEEYLFKASAAGGPSILKKITQSWQALVKDGTPVELVLLTNRSPDPADNLLRDLDSRTGLLLPRARQHGPRSIRGKARARWAAHAGLDEAQLFELLSVLEFRLGLAVSVQQGLVSRLMQAAGLRHDDGAMMVATQWVAQQVIDGRRRLSLTDIRDAIGKLDLLARRTTDPEAGHVDESGRPLKRDAPGAVAVGSRMRVGPGPYLARARAAIEARIPSDLVGREEELKALQEFCASQDAPAYAWWKAEQWAGKTALMAMLVARCRPPGVEIVSYFISEVLGNNTRDAFLREVCGQLAEVASRLPGHVASADELVVLMAEAAQACRGRGTCLLMVIDALDEDSGAGSIAALLPMNPPDGMRILVTGRPNPPIPGDVPGGHPLRKPSAVRSLTPWAGAQEVEVAATRDVHHLLETERGRDVLGFLTVARGALACDDLAVLGRCAPYEVRQVLHSLAGRSLIPDTSAYSPLSAPETVTPRYLLGHTELYRTARRELGPALIGRYEEALHAWADTYCGSAWQADAPAYLLYDYPLMLDRTDCTDREDRLARVALDPYRQKALLRRSSADAALAHLDAAQQAAANRGTVDLAVLAALAVSRDILTSHTRALPPALAQAFARLGRAERAMDLARGAGYPAAQASQLASVALTLEHVGNEAARQAAQEAVRWARQAWSEADPSDERDTQEAAGDAAVALITTAQGVEDLAEAHDLLAHTRLLPRSDDTASEAAVHSDDATLPCIAAARTAEAVRRHHPDESERLLDWAEQRIEALSGPGEHGVRSADPSTVVEAWAAVARAATPARATRIRTRIAAYTSDITTGLEAPRVRAAAAQALAAENDELAAAFARQGAEDLVTAMQNPDGDGFDWVSMELGITLNLVVRALADTGSRDQARELVDLVPEELRIGWLGADVRKDALAVIDGPAPDSCEALAQRACRYADQGNTEAAARCLDQAMQALADSPPVGDRWQERRLTHLAGALASSGRCTDAATLADSLTDPLNKVQALAHAAAGAGQSPQARCLARRACEVAQLLRDDDDFSFFTGAPGRSVAEAKGAAAQALAYTGQGEAAIALVEEIRVTKNSLGGRAAVGVAAALRDHDPDTAAGLVGQALDQLLRTHSESDRRAGLIAELAGLATAVGGTHQAVRKRVAQAIEEAWNSGKSDDLDLEDCLAIIVIEAKAQPADARKFLVRQQEKAEWGYPDDTQAGFALAHAVLGDYAAARHVAARHSSPSNTAYAAATVAAYLTRTPTGIRSTTESTGTSFPQVLHALALQRAQPDPAAAADDVARLLTDALEAGGWHHALPALNRCCPRALEDVRRIVFTHRGLPEQKAVDAAPFCS